MARVTDQDQAVKWLAIYNVMEGKSGYGDKVNTFMADIYTALEEKIPKDQNRRWSVINDTVKFGAGDAGQVTIKDALSSFGTDRPVDLWIAYAWSSTEAPTYPIQARDALNIELIMTVTTATPYLYTWHMGITRSKIWWLYPPEAVHKGISVGLHCFAAKVMKRFHPRLHYVRSNMAHSMVKLLAKALTPYRGRRVFFANDVPVHFEKDGQVTLYEIPTVLWEVPKEDFTEIPPADVLGDGAFVKDGKVVVYEERFIRDFNYRDVPNGNVFVYQTPQVIWRGPRVLFHWPRYPGAGGTSNLDFLADINLLAEL